MTAEEIEDTGPQEITVVDFLDAVTRAEKAEADLETTRTDLRHVRQDLYAAREGRDRLASELEGIRVLHDTWGDSDIHTLDPKVMWEALADVLGVDR